jgi:hypothetical protein
VVEREFEFGDAQHDEKSGLSWVSAYFTVFAVTANMTQAVATGKISD